MRVWVSMVALLLGGACMCTPELSPGQFLCDDLSPCPEGWFCLYLGAEQRCFDRQSNLCGDGTMQPGEQCDTQDTGGFRCPDYDDIYSDATPICTVMCTVHCPVCGDGQAETRFGELCDDGALNSDTEPDACREDCTPARCGDGVVDTDEECDDGEDNSDDRPNSCRGDCTLPACGDGLVDRVYGESCDDGNTVAGDGCDASCRLECDGAISGEWVHIPSGSFEMGCDPGDQGGLCAAREQPRHTVTLTRGYCIQRTEVTVGQYRACVEAGVCDAPGLAHLSSQRTNWSDVPGTLEDHPVNTVSFGRARTYCRLWEWADLPTEAQWERAARGLDERTYPWGETTPDCTLANYDVASGDALMFGCEARDQAPLTWKAEAASPGGGSPEGLVGMAGNLAEWVLDYFCDDYYALCVSLGCVDPVNTDSTCSNAHRVVRGGGVEGSTEELRTTSRRKKAAVGASYEFNGFRCVHCQGDCDNPL